MSPKLQFQAIRLWHAALVGGFIVAYLTGDEDTYAMHLFSGWWVVGMVALRLLAAAFAPVGSPLRLTRPNRPKPMALAIAGALALVGAAAVSGVAADWVVWLEDVHEGIAEFSLWLALAHVAVAVTVIKGRKWLRQAAMTGALMVLAMPALAEPARDAILAAYAVQAKAENPAFAGLAPSRGEALYRSRNAANKDAASCSTCHTDDPTRPGRHVKTGRAIEPMAVSANPKRFTDAEKVEERFTRDCQSVLGRACTAVEKGDYVAFMASR
jgi:hypothetical protein